MSCSASTPSTLAAVAVLCLATPAPAQSIAENENAGAIDYDALLLENLETATELMTTEGRSRLQIDLPGNVTVWADLGPDGRSYSAMDGTESGSVGCIWNALNEIEMLRQSCPGLLTEEQAGFVTDYRRQVGDFVADNTFPPVPREDFWGFWETAVPANPEFMCEAAMEPPVGPIVNTFASENFGLLLQQIIATPRLPVSTPCF